MAQAKGPLFSIEASGSIGKTLTFGKNRSRNTIRKTVKPVNHPTLAQHWNRGRISLLNVMWHLATAAQKLTWKDLADANEYSTYNAFLAYNLNRIQANGQPTIERGHAIGTMNWVYTDPEVTDVSQGTVAEQNDSNWIGHENKLFKIDNVDGPEAIAIACFLVWSDDIPQSLYLEQNCVAAINASPYVGGKEIIVRSNLWFGQGFHMAVDFINLYGQDSGNLDEATFDGRFAS